MIASYDAGQRQTGSTFLLLCYSTTVRKALSTYGDVSGIAVAVFLELLDPGVESRSERLD